MMIRYLIVKQTFFKLLLKSQLLALGFILFFTFISALVVGLVAYKKLQMFSQASGLPLSELHTLLSTAWEQPPRAENDRITVLVLGLDTVANRDQPALTDSMLLASIDLKTGSVSLMSLPRDFWLDEYQTKINALYYYGAQKDPEHPTAFVSETLSQITGLPIQHVLTVSLDDVADLVTILGGVEITVPDSFTDEHFPRPGVDTSVVTDLAELQQTVTFEAGRQTMSGERVLEYVRSRKAEGVEGTDLARSQRQQDVLRSVANTLQTRRVMTDPQILGKLTRWYLNRYNSDWPLQDVLSLGFIFAKNDVRPTINTISIPIANTATESGLLVHPTVSRKYDNQWVYIATDSALLKTYIFDQIEQQ